MHPLSRSLYPRTRPFPRCGTAPIHTCRPFPLISPRSTRAAPAQASTRGLQSRFADLRRPTLRLSSPSASPRGWQEDICHCIRTKIITTKPLNGCQQLEGLLAKCAQATGQIQELVNMLDSAGYPPLAYAIASRSKEAVQLLLDHGADPNAAPHGFPALAFAVVSSDDRLVQLLLSYGADPFTIPRHLFMTAEVAEISGNPSLTEEQSAACDKNQSSTPPVPEQHLAGSLNLAMRYWLYQATCLPAVTETPPMASRIADAIPFNEREAAVVVSQTLSRFRMFVSCPAAEPHIPGGLKMNVEEEFKICKRWAEIYSPDAGARALDREVWDRLWQQVSQLWLSEDLRPGSRFTLKPDPLEKEPFLLDLSLE